MIERVIMTLAGFIQRVTRLYHHILLCILPQAQMKNLLKTTPFMEVRRTIWVKLGNKAGRDVYLNNSITLIDTSELDTNIILGDRVALAPNITFITSSGPNDSCLKNEDYAQRYIVSKSIFIDDDTWVGANCVIHPGVHIGKRCIIGSCSNVTKDLPDDCLAYGNPAKVIRRLI